MVKGFGIVVFVCAIGIVFFTVKENFDKTNKIQLVQIDKDKSKKIEKQKEVKRKKKKTIKKS